MRVLTDDYPRIHWFAAPSPEAVHEQALREKQPFDLKEVPVRFTGYELPEDRILIRMEIHHIAFDGRSVMIWQRELFERLRGNTPAREGDLSTRSEDAYDLEPGLEFYHELFADGVPANEMPLKAPRGRNHPGADREIAVPFSEERLARLNAAAKACGVTTFAFLLAGISIVLGVYCGSEDVMLGFPVDMRSAEEKNMAGMFINTAIVRLKPEATKPLAEYLREVSRMVCDAAHDKWLPMSEVIRFLRIAPDRSRNPVFDVGVNYLFTPELCRKGELSVAFSYELQALRRDMNITMHRHDGHMDMLVRYASELFEEALIRRFLEQLSHTLSWMSDAPDAVIAQVRLLPPAQAETVRQFSRNARCCIVDRRGGFVPVGVVGWLADASGVLGAPAKWDEQGGLVLLNDNPRRATGVDQETLPPPMPEKDSDSPVGHVQKLLTGEQNFILMALRDQYDFEYGEDKIVNGVKVNDKCKALAKKIKEIIDTKSSFADWLNNQTVCDQLKFDFKVCTIKNGYPPQYSPEVFRKVTERVENFEENA